jgi:pimeloyl-ACP methyl ester carboxylesterase
VRSHAADDHSLSPVAATLSVTSSDGVTVAVHDLGGTGPPLLLCHATGFHGRVWAPVAARLADRFHCLAPDLRGHGDTTAPARGDLAWSGFADDVLAVVDALGLAGCVAAGHSKGGAALLLAEQRRPGTFAALYCYEPVAFPADAREGMPDGDNPLSAAALRRRTTFASSDAAVANYAAKPPLDVFTDEALRAYVEHGFAPDATGDGIELKCRPEVEAQVYRMGPNHDAFDRLGEVRCPVTVAMGRPAPFEPSSVAVAIVEALPHGHLSPHPELGHFGPMQDPDAIAADIAEALSGR